MQTLKERFEEFILSLNGVESVDRLMAQCDLPGRTSADFLALNRRVIIEQKSLDIDPHHKVPEFFEKHTNLENSVDGDLTALSHLLRRLPEGTKLGIDLYRSLTKGLDDILSYADKQTKLILDCSLSKGLWSAEFREGDSCRRKKRGAPLRPRGADEDAPARARLHGQLRRHGSTGKYRRKAC
jgi:hypothetical protein